MSHRPSVLFALGLRTPFALAHQGRLKDTRPDDLLVQLLHRHRALHPSAWQVPPDDFIVGCAYPEGEQGYNIARTAAVGAALDVPGMTVNRLCASSLEACAVAAGWVATGRGRCFLVGGIESMSRVPRRGANFSESPAITACCPNAYVTMGATAEELARLYPSMCRTLQETVAEESHSRAYHAYARGDYAEQLGGTAERDECLRYPVDRAKMANLKPSFAADGVVTAATSSPLSDGAALGFVVDEQEACSRGLADGLRLLDAAAVHVAPEVMGLGPVMAVRKLLQKTGVPLSDVAAIEMNEAFAIQVLACQQELALDDRRLNAWGGALALGHPLGASGLRLVMTLAGRLRQIGPGALGIATLCVGGGQGLAVLFQHVKLS